jgi:hypothetical protein
LIPKNIKNNRLLNKLKRKMAVNFHYEKTSEAKYKKFSKKYKILFKKKSHASFLLKPYHNYLYLKHKEKYKKEFETYNEILINRNFYFTSLLVYHSDEIIKHNEFKTEEYKNYIECKEEYYDLNDAFKTIDEIKDIVLRISELLRMASKEISETKYLQMSSAFFASQHREPEILAKGRKASSLTDEIKRQISKLNSKMEESKLKFNYKTGKIADLAERDFSSDMISLPLFDIYTDIQIINELAQQERNIESLKPKISKIISHVMKKHFDAMEKKNDIDHHYQDIKDKIRFPLMMDTINKLKDLGLNITITEDEVLKNLHENDYF